ncbi:unnamed protein product [Lepeophtheirus salmonis]|uniref:(salmon louse) hypothetical protein n=1 Tax=Lepeophtheirus salmonis TaxID=72036 RepID=A0A7R8CAS1_LEPSM|nr:unnamed protein product [Lepeophtheirus salmonis]CAF2749610.1 unnamed protein product [Lepeophtheirus salmonis]
MKEGVVVVKEGSTGDGAEEDCVESDDSATPKCSKKEEAASGEAESEGEEAASGEAETEGEEAASGEAESEEEEVTEDQEVDESGDQEEEESGDPEEEESVNQGDAESGDQEEEEESGDPEEEESVNQGDAESGDQEEDQEESENQEEDQESVGDTGTCDIKGIDKKLRGCLNNYESRIQELEDIISSNEGGGLEDQIELVLVKKGVIDCENNTQCDDDKACLDSRVKRDRMLCEDPCERNYCPVQHSECVVSEHKFSCECKEGFHGNATERCVPDGFTAEENGKHYRIFDDSYVEFDNATAKCEELGARLPVLDSPETIKIVKKYLEQSNFTVFEQWDRSSRRVWLGLILSPRSGLVWVDNARVMNYPISSRLFVWEARRALSAEASYADNTRHYGFYIDGDIAKLPGGGRRGAAVLCELLSPSEVPDAYATNEPPQRQDYYPGDQNKNYYDQQPPQNNPYYAPSSQAPPQNNPYQPQARPQIYYPPSRQQPNQARPQSQQPPRRPQGYPPNYPI